MSAYLGITPHTSFDCNPDHFDLDLFTSNYFLLLIVTQNSQNTFSFFQ